MSDVILVSNILLLTKTIFYKLFLCLHFWHWISKCRNASVFITSFKFAFQLCYFTWTFSGSEALKQLNPNIKLPQIEVKKFNKKIKNKSEQLETRFKPYAYCKTSCFTR